MKYNKTLGIFTVKKIYFYLGDYYTYGGFGSYLDEIKKYFQKTILVAHVTERKPGVGCYKISSENLKVVHLLQSGNEFENLIQLPFNFVKSIGPVNEMDVVHCRMPDYTGIIGVVLSRIKRKEFYIQIIADWEIEAKKTSVLKKCGLGLFLKIDYYFYDFLERLFSKNRLVFAQGNTSFDKHKNNSEAKLICSTAHYNTDIGVIKNRFENNNEICLLHIGRLTGVKNQELLIKAVEKLNIGSRCVWKLNILGDGPLRDSLNNLINKLGLENRVFLRGQIDRSDEFWNYFDISDAFLMSSRSEGTPKVILEAMARSVPVVSSNVGGIPYMVPDLERGMLYEDNNLDELVRVLQVLKKDSNLRNNIIENGMKFAKENTLENATKFMVKEVSNYFKWEEK